MTAEAADLALFESRTLAVLRVTGEGLVLRSGEGLKLLLGRDPSGEGLDGLLVAPGASEALAVRTDRREVIRANPLGARGEAVTLDFRVYREDPCFLLVGEPPAGEAEALRSGFLRLNSELNRSVRELSRQAAELARTVEVRDALLGLLAWDLRSALDVVSAKAEGLISGGELGRKTSAEGAVVVIEQTALNARGRLDELLGSSDLGTGGLKLNLVRSRASLLAMKGVAASRPLASVGKVELRWEGPREDPFVLADPGRFLQALGHVLAAAIHRTEHGGFVATRLSVEEGWVRIEVRGSGCSLSDVEEERLTRPFTPVRRQEQSRVGARAVGLGLARLVVIAHGGRLSMLREGETASGVAVDLPLAT